MPEVWIPRTLAPLFEAPADALKRFPVWLLLGPRQVGKSSQVDIIREGKRMALEMELRR